MRFQTVEVPRGRFVALELAIELASRMRQPVEMLRRRDPGLCRQLREATSSIALNLGGSRGRSGRDRLQHFRIAAGSAEGESDRGGSSNRTALRLAAAWGDLQPEEIGPALLLVDHIVAMLWRLTH